MLGSGRSRGWKGQGLVSPVPREWCHLGLWHGRKAKKNNFSLLVYTNPGQSDLLNSRDPTDKHQQHTGTQSQHLDHSKGSEDTNLAPTLTCNSVL